MALRQNIASRCVLLKGVQTNIEQKNVHESIEKNRVRVENIHLYGDSDSKDKKWIVLLKDENDAKRLINSGSLTLTSGDNQQEVIVSGCPDSILPEKWIKSQALFDVSMKNSVGYDTEEPMSEENPQSNSQGTPAPPQDNGSSSESDENEQDRYVPTFDIPSEPVSNVPSWTDSQRGRQQSQSEENDDKRHIKDNSTEGSSQENMDIDGPSEQQQHTVAMATDRQKPNVQPMNQQQNFRSPLTREQHPLQFGTVYENYKPKEQQNRNSSEVSREIIKEEESDEPPPLPPRRSMSQAEPPNDTVTRKSSGTIYSNTDVTFGPQGGASPLGQHGTPPLPEKNPSLQPPPRNSQQSGDLPQMGPFHNPDQPQSMPQNLQFHHGSYTSPTMPQVPDQPYSLPSYAQNPAYPMQNLGFPQQNPGYPGQQPGYQQVPGIPPGQLGLPTVNPQHWEQYIQYLQMYNPHLVAQAQAMNPSLAEVTKTPIPTMPDKETQPPAYSEHLMSQESQQAATDGQEKEVEGHEKKTEKKKVKKKKKRDASKDKPADQPAESTTKPVDQPVESTTKAPSDGMDESKGFNAIKVTTTEPMTMDAIVFYFENRGKSGGGDVKDTELRSGDEKNVKEVILTFESATDAQNALKKGTEHNIGTKKVRIEKYNPNDPSLWEEKKLLISNVSPKTSEDCLFNFLEARCNSTPSEKIVGEDEMKVIVCFETKPDIDMLKSACEAKPLEGNKLRVSRLEVSRAVCVTGIESPMTTDLIENFFENKKRSGGGPTERVDLDQGTGTCIIHYINREDAENVCKNSHLPLTGKSLTVTPYHECIGLPITALRKAIAKMAEKEVEISDVDIYVIKFILKTPLKKELEDMLTDHHAITDLSRATKSEKLVVRCTLTELTKSAKKVLENWEEKVNKATTKFLSVLTSRKLSVVQEVWKDVIENLRSVNIPDPEKVGVILEQKEFIVVVVGVESPAQELEKKLKVMISDVESKSKRGTKTFVFEKHQLVYLRKLKFKDDMKRQFPDVEISINIDKKQMTLTGKPKEMNEVHAKMLEAWTSVEKRKMSISKGMKSLLNRSAIRQMVNKAIEDIKVTWKTGGNGNFLEIWGKTKRDAEDGLRVVKETLKEKMCDVSGNMKELLKSKEWQSLAKEINSEADENLLLEATDDGISLTGTKDVFDSVVRKVEQHLKEFHEKHAVGSTYVRVDYGALKWIEYFGQRQIQAIEKEYSSFEIKITTSFQSKNNGLKVSGKKMGLDDTRRKLTDLVHSIREGAMNISERGLRNYLKSASGIDKIKRTGKAHQTFIKVSNKEDDERPEGSFARRRRQRIDQNIPKKIAEVEVTNNSEQWITVMKGDITQMRVDAVVNAANEDLDHCGGLAKAISDAAGKAMDDECRKHVQANGQVKTGDAVMTTPGKLTCKKIIHVVGPRWIDGKNGEHLHLESAVKKCLQLTTSASFKSVAIPAISAGIFSYPLEEAVHRIVNTIISFFMSSDGTSSSIRHVYLCDTDHKVINAFTKTLKQFFGAQVISFPSNDGKGFHDNDETREANTGHRNRRDSSPMDSESKGIQTCVVKKELAKMRVDIIVNSAHHSLDLTIGATSKSLLDNGGQSILDECKTKYPRGVRIGKVAVTKGGRLQCSQVYHGTLQKYEQGRSSDAMRNLQAFVEDCLKLADTNGLSSIAFPALGTGQLGYPADAVAKKMFQCVEEFEKRHPTSSLKKVFLVVYPRDTATIRAFEYVESSRKPGEGATGYSSEHHRGGREWQTQDDDDGEFKKLGKLNVRIKQGDITKERADVILNSVGGDLDMSRGAVSKAIQHAAGRGMLEEFKSKAQRGMKENGFIVTSGGDMKCQCIIHVRAQRTADGWSDVLTKSLDEADLRGFKTVAIPAFGTGGQGLSPDEVASAMFKGIKDFSPSQNLQSVSVVIFQREMVEKFQRAMKHVGAGLLKRAFNYVFDGVKNFMDGPEEVRIRIWSDQEMKINAAKKSLKQIVKEEFSTEKISNFTKVVSSLNENQRSHIAQIAKDHDTDISIGTNNTIILKGLKKDVFPAKSKISDILYGIENRQRDTQIAKELVKNVQWQYQDSSNKWRNFNPLVNLEVEDGYKKMDKMVRVRDRNGVEYVVDLKRNVEHEKNKPGTQYKIRRHNPGSPSAEGVKTPSSWTGDKGVKEILLKPGDKEYERVKEEFSKNSSGNTIVKIYRVQNGPLYLQYAAKRDELSKRNRKNPERWLWHGTSADTIGKVINNGFNRSYCGKNGTAYGKGVYFAVDSSYSVGYCTADINGVNHIFSAQVLTGESCPGNSGMSVLPDRPGGKKFETYDSASDNPSSPQMFIIFHDSQAYPTYHIEFQ